MRKKRAFCAGKVGVTVSSAAANAPSSRIRVGIFMLFFYSWGGVVGLGEIEGEQIRGGNQRGGA
jgi:hypothetical protein